MTSAASSGTGKAFNWRRLLLWFGIAASTVGIVALGVGTGMFLASAGGATALDWSPEYTGELLGLTGACTIGAGAISIRASRSERARRT